MKRILTVVLFSMLSLSTLLLLTACGDDEKIPSSESIDTKPVIDIPVEVFDVNPLTGFEKDSDYPEAQRPVAIMVNNINAAMPQSGISSAPVIYEMVTEGGITRLMAVFPDYKTVPKIGPIRSTRDQFVDFMFPINAIGVHIGSSIYATSRLREYQYTTLDGYYLGHTTFEQDKERSNAGYANEHSFYTNGELMQAGIDINGIDINGGTTKLFDFVNPGQPEKTPTDGTATQVDFKFSSISDSGFTYNPETLSYLKTQFGVAHFDAGANAQLNFKNIFILNTSIGFHPDGTVPKFDLASGTGFYVSNGGYEEISWTKGNPTDPMMFFDKAGNSLKVNAGNSYISIVDTLQLQQTLEINDTLFHPLTTEPVA